LARFALKKNVPTIFQYKGYRFFFFSGEGQEPPHVHIESAEKYAKFWLKPVLLARSRGFRSHEIKELGAIVETHKKRFEEKWYAKSFLLSPFSAKLPPCSKDWTTFSTTVTKEGMSSALGDFIPT
jgi:hypothetical protein